MGEVMWRDLVGSSAQLNSNASLWAFVLKEALEPICQQSTGWRVAAPSAPRYWGGEGEDGNKGAGEFQKGSHRERASGTSDGGGDRLWNS